VNATATHLKFVTTQPCLICGRTPSDAHHIKFAEQRAMGRKVSDRFAVPLRRLHHRELHRRGNERVWWRRYAVEPLGVAVSLWKQTHAVESAADGANEFDRLVNGSRFSTDDAASGRQNNETNRI
jgi:hypothetical protein